MPANTQVRLGKLNAGIIISGEHFLVGYSASNFNEPEQIFLVHESRLPMRHTLQAAIRFPFGNPEYLSGMYLTCLYLKQQDFHNTTPGIAYRFRFLKAGLAWRIHDAAIESIGYTGKNISVGYSYDLTASRLTNATARAHEITVGWNFGELNERRPYINWLGGLF